MPEYRGFVSFATTDQEFNAFKVRINNYYNWCGALKADPMDDENYIAFSEAYGAYEADLIH